MYYGLKKQHFSEGPRTLWKRTQVYSAIPVDNHSSCSEPKQPDLCVCSNPSLRLSLLQHTYRHMDHIHIHPSPLSFSSSREISQSWPALSVYIVWLHDPIKEVHLTGVIMASKLGLAHISSKWLNQILACYFWLQKHKMLNCRAGFDLADTYIISRGQLGFLRLHFRHLANKVPINELYRQIMKMSPAEKGG